MPANFAVMVALLSTGGSLAKGLSWEKSGPCGPSDSSKTARCEMKLKKLSEQVLVITGASSGIGLTTAKMAAKQRARVVLASRDEEGLRRAVEEIRADGGEAVHVVADVSDLQAVHQIADTA